MTAPAALSLVVSYEDLVPRCETRLEPCDRAAEWAGKSGGCDKCGQTVFKSGEVVVFFCTPHKQSIEAFDNRKPEYGTCPKCQHRQRVPRITWTRL